MGVLSRRTGVLTAALVLGLLGSYEGRNFYEASDQQHANYSYQPAGNAGLHISTPTKTPAPGYQPYCNNPDNHEDADLCAQWAAVQQTGETNRLASLALKISVFALLFTVVGTLLLLGTFWEQRETSRRELQAYVSVKPNGLPRFREGEKATATISIANGGTTPAYEVHQYGTILIDDFPLSEDPMSKELIHSGVRGYMTLHHSDSYGAPINGTESLTRQEIDAVLTGKKVLWVIGNVDYTDTFRIKRRTEFCFFLNKDSFDRAKQQTKAGTASDQIELRWNMGTVHTKAT